MPANWCPFDPGSGKVPDDYDVYLYPNASSYSRGTGVGTGAPGFARIKRAENSERIVERQLHMNLDVPNVLMTVLPHETTHVVLAGRFGAVRR